MKYGMKYVGCKSFRSQSKRGNVQSSFPKNNMSNMEQLDELISSTAESLQEGGTVESTKNALYEFLHKVNKLRAQENFTAVQSSHTGPTLVLNPDISIQRNVGL